jgi:hypothetical protein
MKYSYKVNKSEFRELTALCREALQLLERIAMATLSKTPPKVDVEVINQLPTSTFASIPH